jgi:hypothetical protein
MSAETCRWCAGKMRMQYPGNDPENGPAELSCVTGCPTEREIGEYVHQFVSDQAHDVKYPQGCSCMRDLDLDPFQCECFALTQLSIGELKQIIAAAPTPRGHAFSPHGLVSIEPTPSSEPISEDPALVAHLGVGDTEAEAIADAFAKVATAMGIAP